MSKSLSLPTLVLNSSWQAICVHSVRKCMQKVFSGNALLLDHEDFVLYDFDQWCDLDVKPGHRILETPRISIRAPEIIVLKHYNKFPEREVKLTRRNLLIRDNFTCQYSGKRLSSREATIDHVIPQSKGGKTAWDNVVVCCPNMNSKKGNKTLAESGLKLLKTPIQPSWSPIYSRFARFVTIGKCPESWKKFIPWDPNTYWDVELVEE